MEKQIAIKYYHFRSFVQKKSIHIFFIDTTEQTAYIFTKSLDYTLLFILKEISVVSKPFTLSLGIIRIQLETVFI